MVFTTDGKDNVRDYLKGDSPTEPTHMAIGTGTTTEVVGDTALETEVFRDTLDSQSAPASKKVRLEMRVLTGEANGNTLTEVGLLNAGAGGTLFNRKVHAGISKTASIELRYIVEIEMT